MAIKLSDLKVKLFTDGADKAQIVDMAKQRWISGFTRSGMAGERTSAADLAAITSGASTPGRRGRASRRSICARGTPFPVR